MKTSSANSNNTLKLAAILAITFALMAVLSHGQSFGPENPGTKVESEVRDRINAQGVANVIIVLIENHTISELSELQNHATIVQEEVLSNLSVIAGNASFTARIADWWNPRDLRLDHRFANLPAMAGELRHEGIEILESHPLVNSVVLDRPVIIERLDGIARASIDSAHQVSFNGTSVTGAGQTVCIIDTGIDYTHPELAPIYIGGHDYSNSDTDPKDGQGHGTHVAGIVHASAPNATLVGIKSLDDTGAGTFSDVISGIDWCTSNKATYNISVISMSLGDGGAYGSTDCPTFMDSSITTAGTAGITVVAASGNSGSTAGVSLPACAPGVIAVGSVDSNDAISSFTNRGALLDLLAPGRSIASTALGSGTTTKSGTSMAAPFVSGTAALLYQYNAMQGFTITPSTIQDALKSTGFNVSGWMRINGSSAIATFTPVNTSADTVSANLSIKDRNGRKKNAGLRIIKRNNGQTLETASSEPVTLTKGIYRVEIEMNGTSARKIIFNDMNLTSAAIPLGFENITTSQMPLASQPGFAIDPTALSFTNGSIEIVATGGALYKCAAWNFTSATCPTDTWTVAMESTTPGQVYNITLTPDDPGFIEVQNATTGKDTSLDETNSGKNFGADTIIRVGKDSNNRYRALVEFNLSALPPNASVSNATLRVYFTSEGSSSQNITLAIYRVTKPWIEGTKTGTGNPDGATWNSNDSNANWASVGGDFIGLQETNITINGSAFGKYELNITHLVQQWVRSNFSNYGLVLFAINENTSNTVKDFASGDSANTSLRPVFSANWTEVEINAPSVTDAQLSGSSAKVGKPICLLANISDTTNVSTAVARIKLPDNSTATINLSDGYSCNSKPNDGIWSGKYTVTTDSTHTWTNVSATDGLGNSGTSATGITFEGTTSGASSIGANLEASYGSFNDGNLTDVSAINTSDNMYATQVIPANATGTFTFNWSHNIPYGRVAYTNITIEGKLSAPRNITIQYQNQTTWIDLCTINGTTSDVTASCVTTSTIDTVPRVAKARIRALIVNNATTELTQDIDFIFIGLTETNVSILSVNLTALQNANNAAVSANITIKDKDGELVNSSLIPPGIYTINITINGSTPVQSIDIQGANLSSNTSALVQIHDTANNLSDFTEIFSINPLISNFTTATVRTNASSNASILYKCTGWNFTTQSCTDNSWAAAFVANSDSTFTITLTPGDPGYAETTNSTTGKDAYLEEGNTATKNFGASNNLRVGKDGTDRRRALIELNLSAIPLNASITNATLRLHFFAEASSSVTTPIAIYRITTPWIEGTKTGTGNADGVTWNTNDSVNNWGASGGDFIALQETNATLTGGSFGPIEFNISHLVQQWIRSNFSNFGLVLLALTENTSNTYKDFASGDHTNASMRPVFSANWTETDIYGPTVRDAQLSGSSAKIGKPICLIANISDGSNVSSATAWILLPGNTSEANVTLTDGYSCNSKPNDGIWSGTHLITTDGTHTWKNVTASDGLANSGTTNVSGITFDGTVSGASVVGAFLESSISSSSDGVPVSVTFINTSDNLYATQAISSGAIGTFTFNWSQNIPYGRVTATNITYEGKTSAAANLTIQWQNGTAWIDLCTINQSTSDTTTICTTSTTIDTVPRANKARVRTLINNTGALALTQDIDYVFIGLTLSNASIIGINLTHFFDATSTGQTANVSIFDKDGELVNVSMMPPGIYTINITLNGTSPVKGIDLANANISANITSLVQVHDTLNNVTSFGELYSINPLIANFTLGTVRANASVSAKWLFKCASWNFTTQSCPDNRWARVRRLTGGSTYSLNLTPGDPGYGESNATITVIDSNESLVSVNETVLSNDSGMVDVAITPGNTTTIKTIVIFDHNESSVNDILKIERVPSNTSTPNGTLEEGYSVDASELDFKNGTINHTADGNQLWKCLTWNFTTQTCPGTWTYAGALTVGLNYTVLFNSTDPGYMVVTANGSGTLDANVSVTNSTGGKNAGANSTYTLLTRSKGSLKKNQTSNAKVTPGYYDVVVNNSGLSTRQIHFKGLKVENDEVLVKAENVVRSFSILNGGTSMAAYAIDPSALMFESAIITVNATGNTLYKCTAYNFVEQSCDGPFAFHRSVAPGQLYNITINSVDPGFIEGSVLGDTFGNKTFYSQGDVIQFNGTLFENSSTVEVRIKDNGNVTVSGFPFNITSTVNGTWNLTWNTSTTQTPNVYYLTAKQNSNASYNDTFRFVINARSNLTNLTKPREEATFAAVINNLTTNGTDAIIIFHHNAPSEQAVRISTGANFTSSLTRANTSQNVTLVVSNWNSRFVRIAIGNGTDVYDLGTRSNITLNATSKNATNATVNATIEILETIIETVLYNSTNTSHTMALPEGSYDIRVQPTTHAVREILIHNAQIGSNTTALVDIGLPPPNSSPFGAVYRSLNPGLLLFDNASVNITASENATTVYKCSNWSFSGQTCLDNIWVKVADTTANGSYTFILTAGDPGYLEVQNATSGKDTYINEQSQGKNFGAANTLRVGTTASNRNRALVELNISSLPANATVTNATLRLHFFTEASSDVNSTIAITRLTTPWIEGSGTGTGNPDGATWNSNDSINIWGAAGGDMSTDHEANRTINASAFGAYEFNITHLVQQWVKGNFTNLGLIIANVNTSISNSHKDFASGDHVNISMRPVFTVNWTEVEIIAPRVRDPTLSGSSAKIGDTICLLVNVTDESIISSVQAQIVVPGGGVHNLTLLDNQSTCNSVPNNNIYSGAYTITVDGTHNWSAVNATDNNSNANNTRTTVTFEGSTGAAAVSASFGPVRGLMDDGSSLNVALVNTSNNVYATQTALGSSITFLTSNWSFAYTTETLSHLNVTIEDKYTLGTLSGSLEWLNNGVWTTACALNMSSAESKEYCDLTSIVGTVGVLNTLQSRIVANNTGIASTQDVDLIMLGITIANITIPNATLNTTVLDALGNQVNSSFEIINASNMSVANTSATAFSKVLPHGKYKLLLKPRNRSVNLIEMPDINLSTNLSRLVDIQEGNSTAGFLFAVNPILNNTNFTIIANGTPLAEGADGFRVLKKCTNWNFTTSTCNDGNWTPIASLASDNTYRFTILGVDPGFDQTVTTCLGENLAVTKSNFSTACAGNYPGPCFNTTGARASCDDNITEDFSASVNAYAGIQIQSVNTSVTDCSSIQRVEVCREWWVDTGFSPADCELAIDNQGGANFTNITTSCPGVSANPGHECFNVTGNKTWSCSNFFGASGTRARAWVQTIRGTGGAKLLSVDFLYYNITYTATGVPVASGPPNQTVELGNATTFTWNLSGTGGSYTITRNGTTVEGPLAWVAGRAIVHSPNTFFLGDFNLTLVFNDTAGNNGTSSALLRVVNNILPDCADATGQTGASSQTNITIDGNLADWAGVIGANTTFVTDLTELQGDPDNETITSGDRDMTRFATTFNNQYIFFYYKRGINGARQVSMLAYLDFDNDLFMNTTDKVLKFTWSGSNRIYDATLSNYTPALIGGDPMLGDGKSMNGSLGATITLGNGVFGGGFDGTEVEANVSWAQLGFSGPTGFTIKGANALGSGTNLPSQVQDNIGSVIPSSNSFLLFTPHRAKSGINSSSVFYDHDIINCGNKRVTIELTNTSSKLFNFSLFFPNQSRITDTNGNGRADLTLNGTESQIIIAQIVIRNNATFGDIDRFIINATGTTNNQSVSDNTTVAAISITPKSRAQTATANTSVILDFVITNFQTISDVINVNVTSGLKWNITLLFINGTNLSDTNGDGKVDVGNLTPSAISQIRVVLAVPPGTLNGTVDSTNITINSTSVITLTDRAVSTTTVRDRLVIVPDYNRTVSVGDTVFSQFNITNNFNETDTIDVTRISTRGWNTTFFANDLITPLSDGSGNGAADTSIAGGGTTKSIYARMNVPANASPNEADNTTIFANSTKTLGIFNTSLILSQVRSVVVYNDSARTQNQSIFEIGHPGDNRIAFTRAFQLSGLSDVYFSWFNGSGLYRQSPNVTVVGGQADDNLTLNTTSALDTWTLIVFNPVDNSEVTRTQFVVRDPIQPNVTDPRPTANTTFNTSNTIELSVNVTDNVGVFLVFANITRPDGTLENITLNYSGVGATYNFPYTIPNKTGTYVVRFFANDTSGNVNYTINTTFFVNDTEGPRVTAPNASNANFTQGGTTNFTVNVTDNINVSVVIIIVTRPNGSQFNITANVLNGSIFNATIPTTTGDPPGLWNITVFANDTSNNINSSVRFNFTVVDVTFPVVTALNVSPTIINQSGSSNITVNVSDNFRVDTVLAQIKRINGSAYNITMTLLSGITYNATLLTTIGDPPGMWNITIIANDTVGNENRSLRSNVTVNDVTPPSVTAVTVKPEAITTGQKANISANVTDNYQVDTVIAQITRINGSAFNLTMNLVSGITYNATLDPTSGDPQGIWNITIIANDTSNNINNTINSTVTILGTGDTLPPNVTAVNVTPGVINQTQFVNITANVTDNFNVSQVLAVITRSNGSIFTIAMSNLTGATYNVTYTVSSNEPAGIWNVTINATDTSDFYNDSLRTNFTVLDITGPRVFAGNASPGIVPQGNATNITVNFTDETLRDTIIAQITRSNGSAFNITMTSLGGNRFNASVLTDGNDPIGLWNVTFIANDSSGNVNNTVRTNFTVIDILPPNVTALNATPSTFNQSMAFNLTVNVSDNVAVGTVLAQVTRTNGSSFNFTMSLLTGTTYNGTIITLLTDPTGRWNITIIANDTSGNVNNSVSTFVNVVDITPPNLDHLNATPSNITQGQFSNITVNASDESGIAAVLAQITRANGSAFNLTLGLLSGITWNATLLTTINDPPGLWNITIIINDSGGNVNMSLKTNITVNDVTNPAIPHINITPSITAQGGAVNITANVTDSYRVDKVIAQITRINGSAFNVTMTLLSGITYNATGLTTSGDPPGLWNVTIIANDTAGNINSTNHLNFTVTDTTRPRVINANATPSNITQGNFSNITVNVTDNFMVDEVFALVSSPNGSESNLSFTLLSGLIYNATFLTTIGEAPGLWIFTIIANDTSGNRNDTVQVQVRVNDIIAPAVTALNVSPTVTNQGVATNITVNVTDNFQRDEVRVQVTRSNGSAYNATMSLLGGNRFNYSLNVTPGEPGGTYMITILANDTSNNVNQTVSFNMTVNDITAPRVTALNATPSNITQGQSSNVTVNVTDETGVGVVIAQITRSNGSAFNITMTLLNGSTYNGTVLTTSNDPPGLWNITIIANDTSGNVNSSLRTNITVNDVTGPLVTGAISASVNATPSVINPGQTSNVTVNVTDNIAVDKVLAQITRINGSAFNITMSLLNGSIYNATLNTTTGDPQGLWNITIIANDTSGNVNNSLRTNITVTVGDLLQPNVTAPNASPGVINQSQSINFTLNVTDNVNVSIVIIIVTRPNGSQFNITANVLNGTIFNATIPTNPGDPPGLWNITVFANDTSNNINNSIRFNFTVNDVTNPAVTALNITPSIINQTKFTNITVNVTDNYQVDRVLAQITRVNGSSFNITMSLLNGSTYNATVNTTIGDAPGRWNVTIIANDTVGNVNRSQSDFFTVVDITPPGIILSTPPNGSRFNITDRANLSVNSSDNFAVARVIAYITLPNSSIEIRNMSGGPAPVFSVLFTNFTLAGTYNITIISNDTSGNANTTTLQIVRPVSGNFLDIFDQEALVLIDPIIVTVPTNVSGVVDLNITLENQTIINLRLFNHTESSSRSIVRVANFTNDSNVYDNPYLIDFRDFNMTSAEITINATGQNLFKCTDTILSTLKCKDRANYTIIRRDLIPGRLYKINLTELDPVFGETVNGPNSTFDSWMNEGFPNQTNGAQTFLRIGTNDGGNRARTILRFNLSAVPTTARIDNATLRIYLFDIPIGHNTGNRTYAVHRVNQSPTRDWTEDNVTWNNINATTTWTIAGGDFNVNQAANRSFNGSSVGTYIDFNVTADLQALVGNQTFSFGWIIKDTNESGVNTTRDFRSVEVSNTSQHPVLVITFSDGRPPVVINPGPAGGPFSPGQPVTISANATDDFNMSNVTINLTFPNGSVTVINLINLTKDNYSILFNDTTAAGTYSILYIANDTSGNVNNTVTFSFTISTPAVGGGGGGGGGGGYGRRVSAEVGATPPTTCTDQCTRGDGRCNGQDIQSCVPGSSGCLEWTTTSMCPGDKICATGGACVDRCKEDWSCTSWGLCTDGTQNRGCSDTNNCGTIAEKPSETQACADSVTTAAVAPAVEKPATPPQQQEIVASTPIAWLALITRWSLILLAIALILAGTAYTYERRTGRNILDLLPALAQRRDERTVRRGGIDVYESVGLRSRFMNWMLRPSPSPWLTSLKRRLAINLSIRANQRGDTMRSRTQSSLSKTFSKSLEVVLRVFWTAIIGIAHLGADILRLLFGMFTWRDHNVSQRVHQKKPAPYGKPGRLKRITGGLSEIITQSFAGLTLLTQRIRWILTGKKSTSTIRFNPPSSWFNPQPKEAPLTFEGLRVRKSPASKLNPAEITAALAGRTDPPSLRLNRRIRVVDSGPSPDELLTEIHDLERQIQMRETGNKSLTNAKPRATPILEGRTTRIELPGSRTPNDTWTKRTPSSITVPSMADAKDRKALRSTVVETQPPTGIKRLGWHLWNAQETGQRISTAISSALMPREEPDMRLDSDDYIIIPPVRDEHPIKPGIHTVKLEKVKDMNVVQDILRNGDSIVLIDISAYADNLDRLKRMIKKLKHTREAIGGDLIGLGESWLIATTKGIGVERRKLEPKERDIAEEARRSGKMMDWSQFAEWNRRRKEKKAKEQEE